jgi:nucleolar protein 14
MCDISIKAGDALDENFELSDEDGSRDASGSDEEEEATGADAKRATQASGDHPLQKSFKAAAAELLKKYGMQTADAGGCKNPAYSCLVIFDA